MSINVERADDKELGEYRGYAKSVRDSRYPDKILVDVLKIDGKTLMYVRQVLSEHPRTLVPVTVNKITYKFEWGSFECGNYGRGMRISGSICEYPVGTYNHEDINVEKMEDDG